MRILLVVAFLLPLGAIAQNENQDSSTLNLGSGNYSVFGSASLDQRYYSSGAEIDMNLDIGMGYFVTRGLAIGGSVGADSSTTKSLTATLGPVAPWPGLGRQESGPPLML